MDATGGGRILTNRPDYHSNYSGLEFTLNKRLSNRWMTRVALLAQQLDASTTTGPGAVQNPTRTDATTSGTLSGPQVDGGQIAPRSGGSGKGDLFYNASWQLNANGFYQLGRGFDLGREPVRAPGLRRTRTSSRSARAATAACGRSAVSALDDVRNPNLCRSRSAAGEELKFQRVNLVLAADLFNVLNAGTTLQHNRNLQSPAFDTISEILSPRILRIGVKFQF